MPTFNIHHAHSISSYEAIFPFILSYTSSESGSDSMLKVKTCHYLFSIPVHGAKIWFFNRAYKHKRACKCQSWLLLIDATTIKNCPPIQIHSQDCNSLAVHVISIPCLLSLHLINLVVNTKSSVQHEVRFGIKQIICLWLH